MILRKMQYCGIGSPQKTENRSSLGTFCAFAGSPFLIKVACQATKPAEKHATIYAEVES